MKEVYYSFIIPHHNSPELLNRCLDSIPSREDIEVIVVDDNSDSKRKPQIIRKDTKLEYIDAAHSKGAGHARNVGISVATGKWLLFADCDDFYEKGFINELDAYKYSSYDIIYFDAYHFINLETGIHPVSPVAAPIEFFLKAPLLKKNILRLKHSSNDPWNKMFLRLFVKRIDAKYDEVPAANDAWFCHYAASQTDNVYAISKKLYYWVKTPNSITTSKRGWTFEKQKAQTMARVHHLIEKDDACGSLPYPWRGFMGYCNKNGIFFAIRLYIYKMWKDVNPFKVMYFKFLQKIENKV